MTGPPERRKPPGGRSGRLSGEIVDFAGVDIERITRQPHLIQARRRANFARDLVFAEFGYQHGRALDYGNFVDRQPNQLSRWSTSPTWRAGP